MPNFGKIFKKIQTFNFRPLILTLTILVILTGFGLWRIDKYHKSSTPSPTPSPLYQDFHLVIPKLSIDAPVIPDVDGADKEAYFKALEDGVAHFQGTAKPGEGSNIFIFGHSSFYWWKPGDYKEIFRHLEEVKIGDEIVLWYNQKEYQYRVSETKVVEPDQVDVLAPTANEQVSLMTCVPVGTTKLRLVVIGKPE